MIYAAQFETMNALLGFLTENCCRGAPKNARPLSASPRESSAPRCQPERIMP